MYKQNYSSKIQCLNIITRGDNRNPYHCDYLHFLIATDNATEIDRSDLLTELRILKFVNTLPHRNILRLIGACTAERKYPYFL